MSDSSRAGLESHSTQRLSLLFELSRASSALIELDELLRFVNARTKEVLGAESCAILLLDETSEELFFPVSSDLSPEVESRFKEIRFPADKGLAGWVLQHGTPTIIPDVTQDDRFYPDVDRQSGAQTRDLLYAPLRTRHGVLGVIGLRNKLIGRFDEEDLAFLDALAGSIAIAIENARLYAQVKASEERLHTLVRRDRSRTIPRVSRLAPLP